MVTLLAFSLAINAATAGSLIFFRARAYATPAEISVGQKPMKKFLKEDLGLTPEQLSKIMGLIDAKRPDIVELNRRFGQTRNEMKSLVTADTLDMKALMRKVSRAQRNSCRDSRNNDRHGSNDSQIVTDESQGQVCALYPKL